MFEESEFSIHDWWEVAKTCGVRKEALADLLGYEASGGGFKRICQGKTKLPRGKAEKLRSFEKQSPELRRILDLMLRDPEDVIFPQEVLPGKLPEHDEPLDILFANDSGRGNWYREILSIYGPDHPGLFALHLLWDAIDKALPTSDKGKYIEVQPGEFPLFAYRDHFLRLAQATDGQLPLLEFEEMKDSHRQLWRDPNSFDAVLRSIKGTIESRILRNELAGLKRG